MICAACTWCLISAVRAADRPSRLGRRRRLMRLWPPWLSSWIFQEVVIRGKFIRRTGLHFRVSITDRWMTSHAVVLDLCQLEANNLHSVRIKVTSAVRGDELRVAKGCASNLSLYVHGAVLTSINLRI